VAALKVGSLADIGTDLTIEPWISVQEAPRGYPL
jgi:hypothetical protein